MKVKLVVVNPQKNFKMSLKQFKSLKRLPSKIVPPDYKSVNLRQVSRILGVKVNGIEELSHAVKEKGLDCVGFTAVDWWGPDVIVDQIKVSDNLTLVVVYFPQYKTSQFFIVKRPMHLVVPWLEIFFPLELQAHVKTPNTKFVAKTRDFGAMKILACWGIFPYSYENYTTFRNIFFHQRHLLTP